MKTVIEIMARSVGARPQQNKNCDVEYLLSVEALEQLIELARADAIADEREAISEEWSMCVQSDLEHGVKSLNEQAAKDWFKNYPEIAKFGAWLEARSNT